jgi:hypothetical protein
MNASGLLGALGARSRKFSRFLARCAAEPRSRGLDLGAFLIKPVQRLLKCVLATRRAARHVTSFSSLSLSFSTVVLVVCRRSCRRSSSSLLMLSLSLSLSLLRLVFVVAVVVVVGDGLAMLLLLFARIRRRCCRLPCGRYCT